MNQTKPIKLVWIFHLFESNPNQTKQIQPLLVRISCWWVWKPTTRYPNRRCCFIFIFFILPHSCKAIKTSQYSRDHVFPFFCQRTPSPNSNQREQRVRQVRAMGQPNWSKVFDLCIVCCGFGFTFIALCSRWRWRTASRSARRRDRRWELRRRRGGCCPGSRRSHGEVKGTRREGVFQLATNGVDTGASHLRPCLQHC